MSGEKRKGEVREGRKERREKREKGEETGQKRGEKVKMR